MGSPTHSGSCTVPNGGISRGRDGGGGVTWPWVPTLPSYTTGGMRWSQQTTDPKPPSQFGHTLNGCKVLQQQQDRLRSEELHSEQCSSQNKHITALNPSTSLFTMMAHRI